MYTNGTMIQIGSNVWVIKAIWRHQIGKLLRSMKHCEQLIGGGTIINRFLLLKITFDRRSVVILHPSNIYIHIRMVLTCDSAHSCQVYSADPLGNQANGTWYPTKSHYPDIEATSPCPILIKPSTWQGNDKYKFESHWLDSTMVQTHEVWIARSSKLVWFYRRYASRAIIASHVFFFPTEQTGQVA